MNKKVKWSIISVSAATALTFGGLVVDNQNTANTTSSSGENNTTEDSYSAFNEQTSQSDERFSQDHHHEWSGENGSTEDFYSSGSSDEYTEEDQGSSWDQDQLQQAPSGGFEQGQGSSGTSR